MGKVIPASQLDLYTVASRLSLPWRCVCTGAVHCMAPAKIMGAFLLLSM